MAWEPEKIGRQKKGTAAEKSVLAEAPLNLYSFQYLYAQSVFVI